MNGQKLEFNGDELVVYTKLPLSEATYTASLVMTKEMFQECYKKWIVPQEESKEIKRYDVGKRFDNGVELCVTRVYKVMGKIFLDLINKKGTTYISVSTDDFKKTGHIDSLDEWLEGE